MQLRRGRLDPIGAKQAYYQYYLAHPGEDAGAYQPLHPTEEFNGIISTGYAQAQAELGAGNLGGLALGAATTNGVIFEAMSGYGGNASFGVGLYAVGVFGTFGSGKALHQATVTITRNGEVASQYTMTSGNMTNEEAALGFPRSSLATHTEARAVKQIPMLSGDTMIIMGQYPPCPSCKGAMNVAARVNGTIIIYRWPGGEWSTPK